MIVKDRVKELTRTVGTVDYDLSGTYDGYQGFSVFTDGDTTDYCCTDGVNWEVGTGTIGLSGTKLYRTEIQESSNGGNAVDWGVGDKIIFSVLSAGSISGILSTVAEITSHTSNKNNPHEVTAEQLGVEEGATADQSGAEIVSAIDTELGSTDWKTGGGGGGAGQTETTITQVAHGFSVQDVVRVSGGSWTEALADDTTTLGLGLVVGVDDADTFTVAMSGFYELTAHGLTVGEYYYLSDTTAGALTATEPDISQPLLYVVDADNIVILPYRPVDTSAVSGGSGWDYTSASNPTVSTNPDYVLASFVNTTSCELFICKDNTAGANVWVGQLGTTIS